MGRQFQATIPGQRGHEPVRQPPHVLGERLHDRARRKAGQPDETDVARTPLDQRRHVGLSRAGEILARARALATHRDDHELRGGYAVSGFVSWTSVSVLLSTCRRYSLRSVSILCHSPLASR